jgi:molybdenum cofactor cytidylyltransferase
MISAILLAAGESSRMKGDFKPILKWGKRTVIGECVHQLRKAQLDDLYVVLGHREADVRARLAGTGVQFIINRNYRAGMLSSLKTGLASLSRNTEAVLIALVDQPMITSALVDQLIAAWRTGEKGIIVPTYEGRWGHPVLIGAAFVPAIMLLDEASPEGLRGFLEANRRHILELPVASAAILDDLDSPEDYQRLSKGVEPHYTFHRWQP